MPQAVLTHCGGYVAKGTWPGCLGVFLSPHTMLVWRVLGDLLLGEDQVCWAGHPAVCR